MQSQIHKGRRNHPVFARVWTRVGSHLDDHGGVDRRRRLLSGLSGRVIDIGAGEGRNFAYYPSSVEEVLAVEPEPYLRKQARAAAEEASVAVDVVDGVAEALPVEDNAFDYAVTSLVLCSVTDPDAALAEIRRVLRDEGSLRFFEHVAAEDATHHRLQRFLDATIWPHIAGGCHASRDTVGSITGAGFEIESFHRFLFPESVPTPTSPHVLGEARWTSSVPWQRDDIQLESISP